MELVDLLRDKSEKFSRKKVKKVELFCSTGAYKVYSMKGRKAGKGSNMNS